MTHLIRMTGAAIVSLILLVSSGCGRSGAGPIRAAVTGVVTVDGKPMERGTIRFVPLGDTGGQKTSASIEDGWFVLPVEAGPAVGEHRVEIEAPQAGKLAMDDEEALEKLHAKRKQQRPDFLIVPSAYNQNSELKSTIAEGADNVLTFELSSKPGR